MIRGLALAFLRLTYRDDMQHTLPPRAGTPGAKPGTAGTRGRRMLLSLLRAPIRLAGRLLPARLKARIQNELIDRCRIPVDLVPAERLERSYREALRRLVELEGSDAIGDYLEFGVYQGTSLSCMHRVLDELGLKRPRLFGFDSFQGLPPEVGEDAVWFPGQFRSSLEFTRERLSERGVDWRRTVLVPGYFQDTLTGDLVERHRLGKASVIMIDCDLYSSAVEALRFCEPLIERRAVLVFDDWSSTADGRGEKRAFAEFLREHPGFEVEDLGGYNANSRLFLVTRAAVPATRPEPARGLPTSFGAGAGMVAAEGLLELLLLIT